MTSIPRRARKIIVLACGVLVLSLVAFIATDHPAKGLGLDPKGSLSETFVEPLFGPPSLRPPIRVFRSQKRQQQLAQDPPPDPSLVAETQRVLEKTSRLRRLPKNFDWRTYLRYHPDLVALGIKTRRLAERHYRAKGWREGRLARRTRVVLRYTAGTGLVNQFYCHLAAFTLAAAVGSDVVLPYAAKRDSFGLYFSTVAEQNQVSWAPAPLETILDVERIRGIWQDKGMAVHKIPALVGMPDLVKPQQAYCLYDPPGIDRKLVTRISGIYLARLDLDELVEVVRAAVMQHAQRLLQRNPDLEIPAIVVDLPVPLFILRTLSAPALVQEVAASLPFAPQIQDLADQVTEAMAQTGAPKFNSLHLRVEADAKDWADIIGGRKVLENEYLRAMRENDFSPTQPVFIASGLLTYGADTALKNITSMLQDAGLCSTVHHKEQFISQDVMKGLDSEQTALIDFLVLSKGERFVGFGSSTFSFYLQFFRRLWGIPLRTNRMIHMLDRPDQILEEGGTVYPPEE